MSDNTPISTLQEREIQRLYEELQGLEPTSDEYKAIHSIICDISKTYNENSKIEQIYWTADEDRKHENQQKNKELICRYVEAGLKAAGFVLGEVVGFAGIQMVINANQTGNPIYLKDALGYFQRLLKLPRF